MSKRKYPVVSNAGNLAALRAAACAELGIPDHPVTVKTSVMEAPRTGQYFITVIEITTGPVRVHVLKAEDGEVVRHRYNSR